MIRVDYPRIELSLIDVKRSERQRKSVDTSGLKDSIKQRGVITPIVVESQPGGRYLLLAGERRFSCSKELGFLDIPARSLSELPPIERKIIELEENIKRS